MARITKETAERMLGEVPGGEEFYCSDGRYLKDLSELASALKEMSEETFFYHSNDTKSDFSNWVRDVIGDDKLSRDLRKSTSRLQAAKNVTNRIAWLESKTLVNS